jgi:hypothetical protein
MEPRQSEPSPPLPPPAHPRAASAASAQLIVRALTGLRRRLLAQLLITRVGLLIAGLVAAGFVFGSVDYALRWPSSVRLIFWTLNVALLAWLVWKYVVPVLRFRPSITQVALRLEQSELGTRLGWTGLLTSGIELAQSSQNSTANPHAASESTSDPRLADLTTALAAKRFATHRAGLGGALQSTRVWQSLACTGLAAAALVLMLGWRPHLLRIGMARVLTPWSSAQWPKRTAVEFASMPQAHPLGVALPLNAVLTRWTGSAQRTNVEARYRLVIDGQRGPLTRVLLTSQSRAASSVDGTTGELFERLLDTQSIVGEKANAADATIELVYTLATNDDETEERTIRLVEPPAVTQIVASITPPAYLEQVRGELTVLRGAVDAGKGLDDRARIGPILAGSSVELRVTLNKDVPSPTGDAATRAWMERTLPGLADSSLKSDPAASPESPSMQLQIEPRTWTIRVPALTTSVRTPVVLLDEFGVAAREEASLRLEVAEDRPASAAVIDPAQDEAVLATATVPAVGEGRDDVALWRVALRSQVAKGDPNSPGAIPQLVGEPAEVATTEGVAPAADTTPREMRVGATIDLAALGVVAGDEVQLTATALDARTALAGANSPASTSPTRRLRVISESQLVEQVRAQLAGVRDSAKKLESEQRELGSDREAALGDAQIARSLAQRQEALLGRMKPLQQTLSQLQQRVARNRLEDPALQGVLEDGLTLSQEAAQAASEATRQLSRAAEQTDPSLREPVEVAQRETELALSALVDALAQGDDDWTVRRSLEQLLTQQRQTRAQTQAAGAQTQGKKGEELTQAQRDDLERIARRQAELSQQSSQLIEQLEQRAKQLQESNPSQARAMEQSAARARARQLTQRQRTASEQVRQNQTGQAQENQQAAEQALQDALDSLDESKQAQEQQLRRVLADLMQSLRTLIEKQEAELAKLAPALAGAPAPGLDAGMLALHQNTLGVLSKARKEAAKAEVLIEAIDASAQAQAAAVVALREEPSNYPQADAMERQSLAKLKDALAEGERMEKESQNRDEQRVRRELKKAYAEALELQAALQAQTQPLAEGEETRRSRSLARGVATKQEELRQRLGELRSKTTDFADARVFDYAHTRLDGSMGNAAKTLGEGRAVKSTIRQQSTAVRVLASLVEALKETEKKDALQDAQSAGGGGGQSGKPKGAIPPMAELILLRGMQAEAADRTRAVADEGPAQDPQELEDVTTLQDELSSQTQALLEKLQAAGGGPQGAERP